MICAYQIDINANKIVYEIYTQIRLMSSGFVFHHGRLLFVTVAFPRNLHLYVVFNPF